MENTYMIIIVNIHHITFKAILNITKNLENNQKLKKAFLCLIKSSIDFQRFVINFWIIFHHKL